MNIFGKKADKQAAEAPREPERTPQEVDVEAQRKAEPQRPQRNYKILNNAQLQRVREQKRLAETKLNNLEESLERLRTQQEWLRRHNELKMALTQEKARLYELNKRQAAMEKESRGLERYETFESIQGCFQRMTVLNGLTDRNKRDQSVLERDTEELRRQWDDQEKMQRQMQEVRQMQETHLHQLHDALFRCFELNGSSETAQREIESVQEVLAGKRKMLDSLQDNIKAKEEEMELLTGEMERHRAGRQSMEMHEPMLAHGEAVLLNLDRLQEIETQRKALKLRHREALQKQNEENESLGKVFGQYQDIVQQEETLEEELTQHRFSIQGQDQVKLQERAMQLKSERQMLLSAQSLWTRISTGYNIIEEKTRLLNELRLHIEHTEANVRELEAEVGRTTRLCHEKEYTYLLSKGQNVIQLRADLKEGVACSVCGATHHPYHSDTMLDQSKLIGDFRTDYELLASEAKSKQRQLEDMKLELAEYKGRRQAEEAWLNTFRQRQNEDVQEWRIFAQLDASFHDCSPSTNLEARLAMLRQLIENTGRDAENAQKELDAFNFHQQGITELSAKLQGLEQRKSDLNVRLNEINTGCQVMAGQVERLQAMMETENSRYHEVYDWLERSITIKEWMSEWNQSNEGLKEHIQKLMDAWELVNAKIAGEHEELTGARAELGGLRELQQEVKASCEGLQDRMEKCRMLISENSKAHEKEVSESSAKALYDQQYALLLQMRDAEEREMRNTLRVMHEIDRIKGRNDCYLQAANQMGEEVSKERSRLDYWIQNFNAQNPPVQYAELEQVFSSGTDWTEARRRIRGTDLEAALCQARVDDLNSRFTALQAEGTRTVMDEESLQSSLASQQESLSSQRSDIMLQIARLTVTLEEHEKAVNAANNSATVQDLEA